MTTATAELDVAKKTRKPAEPEPKPEPSARKPMIVQVRGSEEYKAWAEAIASKEGDTLAKLVDRSLRLFAKQNGYSDPPKR